jgi:hypothetical protein
MFPSWGYGLKAKVLPACREMVGAAQTISQETILAEDGRDVASPLHCKLLEKQQGGGNSHLSH